MIILKNNYRIDVSGSGYKLFKHLGFKENKDGKQEELQQTVGYTGKVEQALTLYLDAILKDRMTDEAMSVKELKAFILNTKYEILNGYSTEFKGEKE